MHLVIPTFRSGYSGVLRPNDYYRAAIAGGDESKAHFLYPGRQSADLMFLAGRVRSAEALGEVQRLKLSPTLLARQAEFEELARNQAHRMDEFFKTIIDELRGEQVYVWATWNVLYNLATVGLQDGVRGVFSPDSLITTGGGAKGQYVPPDWREQVAEFFGVPKLIQNYAMSEVMAGNKLCAGDRFHIEPWAILFVLDADTGAPLPREGVQTGRAAFYDLLAETYWGGFVSGDEITVNWTDPCPCGKTTVHIARQVERYGLQRGGDDKISCAAAADAHDAALRYLTDALQ
jgi:hypothetical protein